MNRKFVGYPVAVQFTCGAGSSVEPHQPDIVGTGEGDTVVAIASATHQQALLVDTQTDMPQDAVDQSTRRGDAACLGHQRAFLVELFGHFCPYAMVCCGCASRASSSLITGYGVRCASALRPATSALGQFTTTMPLNA